MNRKMRLLSIAIVLMLLFCVFSCEGDIDALSEDAYGSVEDAAVAFKVQWPDRDEGTANRDIDDPSGAAMMAAPVDLAEECDARGVATVRVGIQNSSGATLKSATFDCSAGQGTLTGVEPQSGCSVVVSGLNYNSVEIYQGRKTGVTLHAGMNHVGAIRLESINMDDEDDGVDEPLFSNESMAGTWILAGAGQQYINNSYFQFDGNGVITELGAFYQPVPAGTYHVADNGSFILNLEPDTFSGVLQSENHGNVDFFGLTTAIYKVTDPSTYQGTWTGEMREETSGNIIPVVINVDTAGTVTDFVGLQGPVTGKFFSASGEVAAKFDTGETGAYNQVVFTGRISGDAISGYFEIDNPNAREGTISLTRK